MKRSLRHEFHQQREVHQLKLDALTIYTRYRGHHQLSVTDHQNLFRLEMVSALEAGGICATLREQDTIAAVCAIKPLTWDTQHFCLPMAKMSVAASPDCPPTALNNLIRDTLLVANKETCSLHVSCEVDIDDYICLNALLRQGAEIYDIKREYRWRSLKGIKAPKLLSQIREYRESDKEQCLKIMENTRFESRFTRDPLLSRPLANKLYQSWLEKILTSKKSERIALVMEKSGYVQACGALERKDFGYAGNNIKMMDGGIYISSHEATGSYYPVIYALAERSLARFDSVQTCVSLNNHRAVRVLERMNAGTASRRYALRLSL